MKNKIIILFAFLLVVTLVPLTFAFEFDNVKSYDINTKTAIIKNSILGIPTSTIAEAQLIYNTDYCLENCEAIMKIDLKDKYLNAVKKIKLLDYFNRETQINDLKIYISNGSHKEKRMIQEIECSDKNKKVCYTVNKEIEETVIDYIDYNKDVELKEDVYYIKLIGKKKITQTVEWIPDLFGVEISEWATWSAGLSNGVYAYYNMSGVKDITGIYNFSVDEGAPTVITDGALIGESINFTTNKNYKLTDDDVFELSNTRNTTLVFWIFPYSGTDIFDKYDAGDLGWRIHLRDGSGKITFLNMMASGADTASSINLAVAGQWTMVAYIRNQSSNCFQINTTTANQFSCTNTFNLPPSTLDVHLGQAGAGGTDLIATIDEIGFWNRSLTILELNDLYNDGVGLTYSTDIATTLSTPLNAYQSISKSINFTATTSSPGTDVLNMTLYVWNSDGTLFGTNTSYVSGTSNTSAEKNWSLSGITYGLNYAWNYLSCNDVKCAFATTNRTFNVSTFVENSQTYTASALTGSTTTFDISLNYTSSDFLAISGTLFYNNTEYGGTKIGSGDNINFTRSLTTPSITSGVNITFYWIVTTINETATIYANSSRHNQSVDTLSIGSCGTYSTVILNYTMYDEENKTQIDAATSGGVIEIDLSGYPVSSDTLIFNYSEKFTGTTNATVCASVAGINESNYRFYVQTRYYSTGYVPEYHYLQNYSFNNKHVPVDIGLYDLLSGDSTEFLMTFKDTTLSAVENAIITVTRKYVGDGLYRTVEMAKTDSFGQAKGHFDTNNVEYKIYVYKEGKLLATFDNLVIYCEDQTIGDCKLDLSAALSSQTITDFYTYDNLNYILAINDTLRTVTLDFNTIDGSSSLVSLNLTKLDNYQNLSICSIQLTSSSGSLPCTIPLSYNNVTFTVDIYKDGLRVATTIHSILQKAKDVFGGNYVFLILLIFISLPLIFLASSIGVIFGVILTFGVAIPMFLISKDIIGAGSILIYLILAGGIIIYQIAKGGRD